MKDRVMVSPGANLLKCFLYLVGFLILFMLLCIFVWSNMIYGNTTVPPDGSIYDFSVPYGKGEIILHLEYDMDRVYIGYEGDSGNPARTYDLALIDISSQDSPKMEWLNNLQNPIEDVYLNGTLLSIKLSGHTPYVINLAAQGGPAPVISNKRDLYPGAYNPYSISVPNTFTPNTFYNPSLNQFSAFGSYGTWNNLFGGGTNLFGIGPSWGLSGGFQTLWRPTGSIGYMTGFTNTLTSPFYFAPGLTYQPQTSQTFFTPFTPRPLTSMVDSWQDGRSRIMHTSQPRHTRPPHLL